VTGLARNKQTTGPSGVDAVVVSMADAQRDLARQKRRRADPPPWQGRGPGGQLYANKKGEPPNWTPNALGLPSEEECPVQCLGIQGELHHMIDSSGQFRSFTPKDFSHAGMQSLFAATPHYPQWAWPRWARGVGDKPPSIASFDDDQVRMALMMACARRGLFAPQDKLRGRGAWRLYGGQLIYHAGEEIWSFDATTGRFKTLETGVHEGHLYARLPALPAPWPESIKPEHDPVRSLLSGFRKWNFDNKIHPVLLLGWIGEAYLGGALDWRTHIFLVGDKGTGKSTLQELLQELFGDALFHTVDTTAAGVTQPMGHDTRPVAIDEMEGADDNRRGIELVKLARAAASGGLKTRGGASGQPSEYQVRSAFLFSAINTPPLEPQDLSRFALLRLHPLQNESTERPVNIDADTCGRMVLAKLMRGWPRFGETLDAYKRALRAGGHDSRGELTYGTLLTCADLLLGPELAEELGIPLTDDLEFWTEALSADSLPELDDALSNWRGCLKQLLTAQVEPWRNGARNTVAQCLDDMVQGLKGDGDYLPVHARKDLARTGLGLIDPGRLEGLGVDDGFVLAIPNNHQGVAKLFHGSKWAGAPGAGVWAGALRDAPIDIVIRDKRVNRVRIAGHQERCSLLVLERYHKAVER
jgi:hypothetical protein